MSEALVKPVVKPMILAEGHKPEELTVLGFEAWWKKDGSCKAIGVEKIPECSVKMLEMDADEAVKLLSDDKKGKISREDLLQAVYGVSKVEEVADLKTAGPTRTGVFKTLDTYLAGIAKGKTAAQAPAAPAQLAGVDPLPALPANANAKDKTWFKPALDNFTAWFGKNKDKLDPGFSKSIQILIDYKAFTPSSLLTLYNDTAARYHIDVLKAEVAMQGSELSRIAAATGVIPDFYSREGSMFVGWIRAIATSSNMSPDDFVKKANILIYADTIEIPIQTIADLEKNVVSVAGYLQIKARISAYLKGKTSGVPLSTKAYADAMFESVKEDVKRLFNVSNADFVIKAYKENRKIKAEDKMPFDGGCTDFGKCMEMYSDFIKYITENYK